MERRGKTSAHHSHKLFRLKNRFKLTFYNQAH